MIMYGKLGKISKRGDRGLFKNANRPRNCLKEPRATTRNLRRMHGVLAQTEPIYLPSTYAARRYTNINRLGWLIRYPTLTLGVSWFSVSFVLMY
jgi:hypothetical protein